MNAGSESGLQMSYLITYTNVNGYLIPNLTYKFGEQMEQLGKYGFLRRDYLKNHKNSLYQITLLQDTICLFIVYSKRANIRFCEWLVFPTYDNAFKQKIAYTGGRTWIIRILGNYSCIFHIGNCNFDNHRRYKTIWKNVWWDFTDVFGGKSFRYISAWRRNQRIFTCEFDLVIRICQYGNHVTQNVFSKEVWLYVICYFIDYLNFS